MTVFSFFTYYLADHSVSSANKFADSLADLSGIGLEKSKRLQRGYLKVFY